ncbi:MAG: hypothetical protein ACI8P0_001533, partial [Planctomycetaceae bacterium]
MSSGGYFLSTIALVSVAIALGYFKNWYLAIPFLFLALSTAF